MNIEELIPRKESAEMLGVNLEEIFADIKDLTPDKLASRPREYILKGRIDIDLLRQIRKLGVEFSISGEKDRLIFSTGKKGRTEHFYDLYENPNNPSSTNRYIKATYSMHSHTKQNGTLPSLGDLQIMKLSKNTSSIILTERGVLRYTWKKDLNVIDKFKKFVLLKKPGLSSEIHKFLEIKREKMFDFLRDFISNFSVILDDVSWDDKEGCQRVIDEYFNQ